MDEDKYSQELNVAVRVVHMACSLCQKLQKGLVSNGSDQIKSKDDNSPVTVADWSVQATVSYILSENFGNQNVSIVAEEDVKTLSKSESSNLLTMVVNTVNESLSEAPRFGLQSPKHPLKSAQILEAISKCNSSGGPKGKHWVLDPVDGTLGFIRNDQYAVALALIDNGEVVIGVLGCPNYSVKGCVMYARKGSNKAYMQPLIHENERFVWPNEAKVIKVSEIDDPTLAVFCEPVERANSNHSYTAGLAYDVGLRKQPLRIYSMVKYAAIACGDAEIFMKFARAGYKEKIWDHAAGVLIVQEAGGVVTDAGGNPLDFTKGIYLEGLDRGIVACSGVKLHEKIIGAVYASWDSSTL